MANPVGPSVKPPNIGAFLLGAQDPQDPPPAQPPPKQQPSTAAPATPTVDIEKYKAALIEKGFSFESLEGLDRIHAFNAYKAGKLDEFKPSPKQAQNPGAGQPAATPPAGEPQGQASGTPPQGQPAGTPPQEPPPGPIGPEDPSFVGPLAEPVGPLPAPQEGSGDPAIQAELARIRAAAEAFGTVPTEEEAEKFEEEEKAAKPENLQKQVKLEDHVLTKDAVIGPERTIYGGFFNEPINQRRYGEEEMKKRFLLYYADPNSAIEAGIDFDLTLNGQWSFDVPSLKTEYTDHEVPLLSPGGFGPFINPATGLPEYINGQVPGRTDVFSYNIVPGFESYVKFNYKPTWTENVPFVGNIINALTDGSTWRTTGRLIYWNTNKESGLLPYTIDSVGAVQDPTTGDINGSSTLKAESGTSGWAPAIYTRYMTGDFQLRLPLLAWGAEQADLGPFDPNKGHAEEDELTHLAKQVTKALTSPTFAGLISYELRPAGNAPDATHETFLEPAKHEISTMLINKDLGLFYEWARQEETTKLFWDETEYTRLGWSLPFKPVFHMFGWDDVLADDYELYGDEFTPKATTDELLRASKLILYVGEKEMKNPKQGTLLLPPGSQAAQGDVKGKADMYGGAAEFMFNEAPTGNGFFDAILGDAKVTLGVQVEDVKVTGQGDVTVFVGSTGGQGGIHTQTPASVLPDPSGKWIAYSLDYEKIIPMADNVFLRVGGYADMRKLMGDVTDNSYSDDYIKTLGLVVGVTTSKRFSKGPLDR